MHLKLIMSNIKLLISPDSSPTYPLKPASLSPLHCSEPQFYPSGWSYQNQEVLLDSFFQICIWSIGNLSVSPSKYIQNLNTSPFLHPHHPSQPTTLLLILPHQSPLNTWCPGQTCVQPVVLIYLVSKHLMYLEVTEDSKKLWLCVLYLLIFTVL